MLKKYARHIFLAGLIVFIGFSAYQKNQYPELQNHEHWLEEKKTILNLINAGDYDQANAQLSQLGGVVVATATQYKAIVIEKVKRHHEEFKTMNHREPTLIEIIDLKLKATDYRFINIKPDLIFVLHNKALIAHQTKQLEDAIKFLAEALKIDSENVVLQQELVAWMKEHKDQKDIETAL